MTDPGREAVGRAFARILAARHPGTIWLPLERGEVDADPGPGKAVRRLAAPQHQDTPRVKPGAPTKET